MALCPYCEAELPEGVVFCLQCGVRLKEPASPPPPEPKGPEPPKAPRREAPPVRPAAICRFCKSPLNLRAEFCEQCGAPLEEAAPPGLLEPIPKPAPVVQAPPAPLPPAPVPAPEAVAKPPDYAPTVRMEAPSRSAISVPPPIIRQEPPKPMPAVEPTPPPARVAPASAPEVAKVTPEPPKPAPSAKPVPAPVVSPLAPGAPPRPKAGPAVPAVPTPAPQIPVPPPEISKAAPRPTAPSPVVGPTPLPPVPPKAIAVAPPPPQVPPVEPVAEEVAVPPPPEAAVVPKKPFPVIPVIVGVVLLLGVAGGAAWFLLRPKPQQPAPQATTQAPTSVPAQPQTVVTPTPAEGPTPSEVAPPVGQPKKARVAKPEPTPAPPPPAPGPDPRAAEVANLQNLAREAYARGSYAEPADSSAIAYAKRALALAPNDEYARTILENSVNGGKYRAQQAIQTKDFAAAQQVANSLDRLLPGRNDIAELRRDVEIAEKAQEAAHRPPPAPVPALSFRAYHMHSEKAPADKGPYCLGTLSVLGGRIRFAGQSASDGQVHNLEFACSEAREIKKNARVAAGQGGFHIRTASSNTNFVPEDALPIHATSFTAACTK